MNPLPEAVTNETLAKLVVGDSIREAYTNPALAKGATVEDMKDLLDGPQGNAAVQHVLATYAASEFASLSIGKPELLNLDKRLSPVERINLTASGLKLNLQTELNKFLELSTEEQQSYVQGLLAKTVS